MRCAMLLISVLVGLDDFQMIRIASESLNKSRRQI